MASGNSFDIQDGIISWFDGPEWNDVVLEVFQNQTTNIQASAQANAPWEDQSGNARAGLTAQAYDDQGTVSLALAHTVDYGIWLETIQSGRFAIIMRTLEENANTVFREAISAVNKARKGRRV